MGLFGFLTRRKIKPGDFHCEIGGVEAKIVKLSKEKGFEGRSLDWPLHNFNGDYSIICPKMNLEWQDDGGCFCVTTNVPGTCKASRNDNREVGQYTHKWCPYLPGIKNEVFNPISQIPSVRGNCV